MTVQYFIEQAIRAERLARSISDERASEALMDLARGYREKADTMARERTVAYDPETDPLSCS
jgi:hypothetical protein